MRHLINREDYIKEYLHIYNQEMIMDIDKVVKNETELYEGLLGTLFGGLKMLLKKDWDKIKCKNPSVLNHLRAIDKSLTGYTMTKMEFSSECTTIRQNIADYFNDILDYKLSQIEKEEEPSKFLDKENKEREESDTKGVEKSLNLKDKTLLDSLDKYKSNINTACKPSPKLREYADQMLNSVDIFVNNIIIDELDKKGVEKAKLEEERKKIKEERKKQKEERKKKDEEAKKASEEAMKKLSKERDDAMRSLGITPIAAMDGDKAIDTITKQFSDMLDEFKNAKLNESVLPTTYEDILKNDTFIGIQKSLEELEWKLSDIKEKDSDDAVYEKFIIGVILNKIANVFKHIGDNKIKSKFKDIPSASVQAMMVSLSNAIIYGFMGDAFKIEGNDARLSIMTKCAIDSDATIGFNLPLINPKKPDNGNFFVSIMNNFKSDSISSDEVVSAADNLTEKDLKIISVKMNGNSDDNSEDETKNREEFIKSWGSDVMKQFRQNITKLVDELVQKANEIKETTKKQREAEAAKAQQDSEMSEKE